MRESTADCRVNDSSARGAPLAAASAQTDTLLDLLAGRWMDPASGLPIEVPVRAIAIEESLAGMEVDLVRPLPLGRRFAIISDATTQRVLGARVTRALASAGSIDSIVLDDSPHADTATVARIRAATTMSDALVAVGSGTINDLAKHAAAQDGKPYVVFATAPSMNGYTSVNAAITVNGHKKTVPAEAPLGVFIDLGVFATAPVRMIQAGLGDSLCRSTSQADWLLSRHLFGTAFREAPFTLLADDEPALLASAEALVNGDLDAMRVLARTLVLSGLGMTICGGSYPASQGEHLISHYIDMFAPPERAEYLHGEHVAVATLTMAKIQEAMLSGPPPRVHARSTTREALLQRFGDEIGDACWTEYAAKCLSADQADALSALIAEQWDDLCAELSRARLPAATLASVMTRAGCPRTAEAIGLTADFYRRVVRNARFLRNRYTFLDLAADAGRLDALS